MTVKPKPKSAEPNVPAAYNVLPDAGGWKIIKSDADRPLAVLNDKAAAVQRAKELAKKAATTTKVRVHKRDGSVEIEYTYHKSIATH
jgi:hypothetical protein